VSALAVLVAENRKYIPQRAMAAPVVLKLKDPIRVRVASHPMATPMRWMVAVPKINPDA
jgi:hypothetical protein